MKIKRDLIENAATIKNENNCVVLSRSQGSLIAMGSAQHVLPTDGTNLQLGITDSADEMSLNTLEHLPPLAELMEADRTVGNISTPASPHFSLS